MNANYLDLEYFRDEEEHDPDPTGRLMFEASLIASGASNAAPTVAMIKALVFELNLMPAFASPDDEDIPF
ncbi:MAG: hypothetical protein WAT23_00035 [Chromatiaceae bacterium]